MAVRSNPEPLISGLVEVAQEQTDAMAWLKGLRTAHFNELLGGAPFATAVTKEGEQTQWVENLPADQRLSLIQVAIQRLGVIQTNATNGITGSGGRVHYADFSSGGPIPPEFAFDVTPWPLA